MDVSKGWAVGRWRGTLVGGSSGGLCIGMVVVVGGWEVVWVCTNGVGSEGMWDMAGTVVGRGQEMAGNVHVGWRGELDSGVWAI